MTSFPVPPSGQPRILGLFAHPDDEVFCLGGTMAKFTDSGAVGKIVSLTRGEAGQIRDVSVASRRTLGAVREAELAAAGAALGVADTECFDFPDGTLTAQPLDTLVDLAVSLIEEFVPDVVVSFGPDGAYGHPDHIVAGEMARQASALSTVRPAVLQAVFPRSTTLLVRLLADWLEGGNEQFGGNEAFAHGLMLFADGSSMLGYAADHLYVRFYPSGSFIIEQGEPAEELFLVLSGSVSVHKEDEAGVLTNVANQGVGTFFGQDGVARGQPRNAHVVAATSVTCFVLSPGEPNTAAGRGATSFVEPFASIDQFDGPSSALIEVDVRAFANDKLRALSCHRSQYAVDENMFPGPLIEGIFGREHFRRVDMPPSP